MGDQTIRKAIIEVRKDKNINAIILRIDSGGGSVLASDMIWKKLIEQLTIHQNKPVIVSMSDSKIGGYYIGCYADKF